MFNHEESGTRLTLRNNMAYSEKLNESVQTESGHHILSVCDSAAKVPRP